MSLVIDFDGVLNDVSARYLRVHRLLVGDGALKLDEYWTLKRRRAPIAEVLAADGVDTRVEASYRAGWLAAIENAEYLDADRPIPGAVDALRRLAEGHRLVLASLRRRPDALADQLVGRGIRGLFAEVLVGDPEGGRRSKAAAIGASSLGREAAWIVGDTEVDLRAGRALGIRTAAVLTGIRDRSSLAAERPDLITEDLPAFARTIGRGDMNR